MSSIAPRFQADIIICRKRKGNDSTRNFIDLDRPRSLTTRIVNWWKGRQGWCCRRWKNSEVAQREGMIPCGALQGRILTDTASGWPAGMYIQAFRPHPLSLNTPIFFSLSTRDKNEVDRLRRVHCCGLSRFDCTSLWDVAAAA
jgi:hypothetical protein